MKVGLVCSFHVVLKVAFHTSLIVESDVMKPTVGNLNSIKPAATQRRQARRGGSMSKSPSSLSLQQKSRGDPHRQLNYKNGARGIYEYSPSSTNHPKHETTPTEQIDLHILLRAKGPADII